LKQAEESNSISLAWKYKHLLAVADACVWWQEVKVTTGAKHTLVEKYSTLVEEKIPVPEITLATYTTRCNEDYMKMKQNDIWRKGADMLPSADVQEGQSWSAEHPMYCCVSIDPVALLNDPDTGKLWSSSIFNETFNQLVVAGLSANADKLQPLVAFLWEATSIFDNPSADIMMKRSIRFRMAAWTLWGFLAICVTKPFPNNAKPDHVEFMVGKSRAAKCLEVDLEAVAKAPTIQTEQAGPTALVDAEEFIPDAKMFVRFLTRIDVSGSKLWPDRVGDYRMHRGGEGTKGSACNALQAEFMALRAALAVEPDPASAGCRSDENDAKIVLYTRLQEALPSWQMALRKNGCSWLMQSAFVLFNSDLDAAAVFLAAGAKGEDAQGALENVVRVQACLDEVQLEQYTCEVTKRILQRLHKRCVELSGEATEKRSTVLMGTTMQHICTMTTAPSDSAVKKMRMAFSKAKNMTDDHTLGLMAQTLRKLQTTIVTKVDTRGDAREATELLTDFGKVPGLSAHLSMSTEELETDIAKFVEDAALIQNENTCHEALRSGLDQGGTFAVAAVTNEFHAAFDLFHSLKQATSGFFPDFQGIVSSRVAPHQKALEEASTVHFANLCEKYNSKWDALKPSIGGAPDGEIWYEREAWNTKENIDAFLGRMTKAVPAALIEKGTKALLEDLDILRLGLDEYSRCCTPYMYILKQKQSGLFCDKARVAKPGTQGLLLEIQRSKMRFHSIMALDYHMHRTHPWDI
jgi:hypothetical protein